MQSTIKLIERLEAVAKRLDDVQKNVDHYRGVHQDLYNARCSLQDIIEDLEVEQRQLDNYLESINKL